VLKARALFGMNRMTEAFGAFESVQKREPGYRLPPRALHDYARAAAASQHPELALGAYRRLVPMAGLLTTLGQAQRVYVEAAVLLMLLKPKAIHEAIAYLVEARRSNVLPSLAPVILGALALGLDRQGRSEEARGVAREAHGAGALVRRVSRQEEAGQQPAENSVRTEVRIAGHEMLAMVAALAAFDDPDLAGESWREYLERSGADGPWVGHARASLSRRAGRR
jgi:hypothetical protein